MSGEALLLLAREPLSVEELSALAATDDVPAVEILSPQVEKNPLALLAASRLDVPPAIRAIRERLHALP